MTGSVIRFPRMDLIRAREIVAQPDLYSGREIVAACEILFAQGDREDVLEVLDLQRAGIVAGFEPAVPQRRPDKPRGKNWQTLLSLYLLLASGVGSYVIASKLFNAIRAVVP